MVGGRADCGGGVMTLHSFDNKRKSSDAAEMKPTDARIHARTLRRFGHWRGGKKGRRVASFSLTTAAQVFQRGFAQSGDISSPHCALMPPTL